MMDQNEVVDKVQDILSGYGYSYRLRVGNAPDGRYVWITPLNSGYDMKVGRDGSACVWFFEGGLEYVIRMRYDDLLDWLPGALEDELITEHDKGEKRELRKMRREYV